MDGPGSGDMREPREMDLCGSGERAKVSELVPEENQAPISEADAWFLVSRGWSKSDTYWAGYASDAEFYQHLKRAQERQQARFRELKRKRDMYLSEQTQRPNCENKFQVSDSNPDSQIDSDSDDEEGGWYGLYERDSSSNKEPGQTTKHCAQLAIDAYNKREGKRYLVVDILRAEKCDVVGFVCFVTFTAKLFNEHDDDAITFRAEVLVNDVDDITAVEFVEPQIIGPLTKEEMLHALGRDRYMYLSPYMNLP